MGRNSRKPAKPNKRKRARSVELTQKIWYKGRMTRFIPPTAKVVAAKDPVTSGSGGGSR